MTTYVESKIVTLNSKYAIIKKNGAFLSSVVFELGEFLKDDKDIIHRSITLQSAQIPYSFYVINFSNQFLKIDTTTFTIPVGNYNANTLITAILTQISPTYPSMTITLNKINGKLLFSNNSNFTIFNNFQYSIGSVLGIADNTNLTSVSNTLELTYSLNLLGIKSLEVRSFVLSMNNVSSTQGGSNTLVASIPVDAVPFGMINYTDTGNNQMTFTNTTLDTFDIEIIDGESNQYVNFNNSNWTMTFILHLTRIFKPFEITPFPRGIPLSDISEALDNKSSVKPDNLGETNTTKKSEPENIINFLQQ